MEISFDFDKGSRASTNTYFTEITSCINEAFNLLPPAPKQALINLEKAEACLQACRDNCITGAKAIPMFTIECQALRFLCLLSSEEKGADSPKCQAAYHQFKTLYDKGFAPRAKYDPLSSAIVQKAKFHARFFMNCAKLPPSIKE